MYPKMASVMTLPDTILKRLNDLPKEVRIKFWEQLEKLVEYNFLST